MHRRSLPVLFAGLASLPMAAAWTTSPTLAATAKSRTFNGPSVDERYGPVRVRIVVKGKKITSIKVVNNPDSARGVFLQGRAIPILKQETLQAQSANIDEVSGVTQTSDAYIQSLRAAVDAARQAKALK